MFYYKYLLFSFYNTVIYKKNMTLSQLEYIIALDNYRHFVTASEKCNVTQPTLSMQIKKLEDSLGVLIFDRQKQPIEPTEIGKQIINQAKGIIQGKNRIIDFINNTRNDVAGKIKIGIIPTISPYLVPLFISSIIKKYPQLDIVIEEIMTHQIIEKIRLGQIDIGIVATPLDEYDILEHPIYYEDFALYVSDNHNLYKKDKISSYDLKLDEIWLLSDGHCFRNHVINLCGEQNYKTSEKLKFSYKTGSIEVLMRFVDKHYGYTLIPHLATLNLSDKQQKHLRFFKKPAPKREISIVTTKDFLKDKLIDALKYEIRENIPEELKYLDNGKIINWK